MPIDKERQRIRKAQYYQENREKALAYSKQRWATQKEKCKEIQKKSNVRHPETKLNYNHNYYLRKKEELLADNKKYRQENREYLRLKKNEWNKNNPQLRAKYTREYQQKNPEAVLQRQIRYLEKIGEENNMNYYETKLALHTWSRAVKKRDGYKCVRCGSTTKLEAHHIKHKKNEPKSAFDVSNGETLCDQCHYREHGKLLGK